MENKMVKELLTEKELMKKVKQANNIMKLRYDSDDFSMIWVLRFKYNGNNDYFIYNAEGDYNIFISPYYISISGNMGAIMKFFDNHYGNIFPKLEIDSETMEVMLEELHLFVNSKSVQISIQVIVQKTQTHLLAQKKLNNALMVLTLKELFQIVNLRNVRKLQI